MVDVEQIVYNVDIEDKEYTIDVNLLSQGPSTSSLSELTDVTITTPTNDQVLTYESGVWVNRDAGVSGVSSVNTFTGDVVLSSDDVNEGVSNFYDKVVSIVGGNNVSIDGLYPTFTLTDNTANAIHHHVTSDITDLDTSLYVPYNGAVSNIDLGNYKYTQNQSFFGPNLLGPTNIKGMKVTNAVADGNGGYFTFEADDNTGTIRMEPKPATGASVELRFDLSDEAIHIDNPIVIDTTGSGGVLPDIQINNGSDSTSFTGSQIINSNGAVSTIIEPTKITGSPEIINDVQDQTSPVFTIQDSLKQLSGQISSLALDNFWNGTGTAFTSELSVGDTIFIDSVNYEVTNITNDTKLFTLPNPPGFVDYPSTDYYTTEVFLTLDYQGYFIGDIKPKSPGTYDIGTVSNHWNTVNTERMNLHGTSGFPSSYGDLFNEFDLTTNLSLPKYNLGGYNILGIGRDSIVHVSNTSGADIIGLAYIDGAMDSQGLYSIVKADALEATEIRPLVWVENNIPSSSNGVAYTKRVISESGTTSWVAGDALYLDTVDSSTPTSTPPTNPDHVIQVGMALKDNSFGWVFDPQMYSGVKSFVHSLAGVSNTDHDDRYLPWVNDIAPTVGPFVGQLWYDTDSSHSKMKIWDGSAWSGVVADLLMASSITLDTSTFNGALSTSEDTVQKAMEILDDTVDLNTVHSSSDGKDHSDVVLNNTHRTSNGSDHSGVSLIDGSRAFTGTVSGVTPTVPSNLATKGYVDSTGIPYVGATANVNLGCYTLTGEELIAYCTNYLSSLKFTTISDTLGRITFLDGGADTIRMSFDTGSSRNKVTLGSDFEPVTTNTFDLGGTAAWRNVKLMGNLTDGVNSLTVANTKVAYDHSQGDGSDHSEVAANTSSRHAELHTIASHSDTTATGAELDELTNGSVTTLHSHAGSGSTSPLTTKGDLYTYDSADARLPIGTDNQILVSDSTQSSGMKWADFSDGYSYFPVWAEESSTIAAGNTEYAYGNGDETPLNSGIVIGVDCELFAAGGEAENATGVNLEVIKNGVSIAETGVFNSNTVVNIATPVTFLAGDIVNFRTKAVTTSGSSCRPVAWFRVAVKGQKGDVGAPGASGDINWQGAWTAGTYLQNDTVERSGSSYVCNTTSTTEAPSDTAVDWDLVASKGDIGPSGSTAPYAHFTITTSQNVGGSNGTVHYINWDGLEIHKDSGFTHSTSTNPNRVQVDADGRYEIKANVQATEGGSSRTTLMSGLRVNGSTINVRGRQRNYSRGSGYGDLGVGLNTEIDLTNGDYIEMSVTVDDSDGTYTVNTINAECEFIIRKIA